MGLGVHKYRSYPLFKIFYLFVYFWLCWAFVAVHRLSLVAARWGILSSGARASYCSDFSCFGTQALDAWASIAEARGLSSYARGLSYPMACGILVP